MPPTKETTIAPAPSTTNGNAVVAKCKVCNGDVERVGRGRSGDILRCRSCGRSPDEQHGAPPFSATPRTPTSSAAAAAGARPCPVEGCPGTVEPTRGCACCAKRARWREENLPSRSCEICGGSITGRSNMKYCKACKPIAQVVHIKRAQRATSNKK